jgi:hypothetical protein
VSGQWRDPRILPLPLPLLLPALPTHKNCHPERSSSRTLRATQSKDLLPFLTLPLPHHPFLKNTSSSEAFFRKLRKILQ